MSTDQKWYPKPRRCGRQMHGLNAYCGRASGHYGACGRTEQAHIDADRWLHEMERATPPDVGVALSAPMVAQIDAILVRARLGTQPDMP